ncbi:MAG: FixH family protein, partial [Dissulfurispiraceae bacterium]
VALLLPFTGFAAETYQTDAGSHTKHYEQSLFKMTERGMFSVEMVVKEQELKVGVNTLDIIVHDKNDKDVAGAIVTVTPWMPEMGHGVYEKPVVRERGGGLYSVENIILIMGGRWELRIKISRGSVEDSVTFDFPDVKISETSSPDEHKMMSSSAPADVDTSAARMSAKKLFKGSYESEEVPIPVGRFITWKLNVATADGRPVKDAEINLNGAMPEHGHGLPTQPEVAKGAGDGHYIVQGLKFSMPGWWVITFKVKTQDAEDTITFNLVVQ